MELLANGSGFVAPSARSSDDDVYISAAQVKRCELLTGDRVTRSVPHAASLRAFPSMVRIESIIGRPAAELADTVRFDDLPARVPTERLLLGAEDPTLAAIEWSPRSAEGRA